MNKHQFACIYIFKSKLTICLFACFLLLGTFNCGGPFIAPNPSRQVPSKENKTQKEKQTQRPQIKENSPKSSEENSKKSEIDFGEIFNDSSKENSSNSQLPQISKDSLRDGYSYRYPDFAVPTKNVRVSINQMCGAAVFYSVGWVNIKSSRGFTTEKTRGRIAVSAGSDNKLLTLQTELDTTVVVLPCTLSSENHYNFIEYDQKSYRGTIILSPSNVKSKFIVVNLLDVEDYLRGVVPLEIGKRTRNDIEAIKAQAIAARTYTYKRIISKGASQPYDLVNTISDQVYGGADVEYRESDLAIKLTNNLIMVHDNSIIDAYYHSTCGGSTSNIEDVWEKEPQPYLKSIRDMDNRGKSYCIISDYYSWAEKWDEKDLESIIRKRVGEVYPGKAYPGEIRKIEITDRFACGRIKECKIVGSLGTLNCGRDKIRFLLRRNSPENPILRSAQFKVLENNPNRIEISGSGYGHGVGMCQMGAIGRARQNQTFDEILKAYYTGIQIKTAIQN